MPVCRPTRSLFLHGTPGHQLSPPGGRRDGLVLTSTDAQTSETSHNAAHNRLALSHEVFTVLRSGLASHRLAVSLPTQLAQGVLLLFCFVLFYASKAQNEEMYE